MKPSEIVKYHRKIVIALTQLMLAVMQSLQVLAECSHTGELARNQQYPTVKPFAVLEYENETL